MKALCFDRFGGPEVLYTRDVPDPALKPGHAVVRMSAIGLNFADIYRRKGHYHLEGAPPYIAGYEGAGIIEELAPDSDDGAPAFKVGDAIGFADAPLANAERVLVPREKLIALPEGISAETAAAVLLQGLTAHYLVRDSHRLEPGETAVVHAAAGGVGLLLVQMAKLRGARVVGLTSSEEKRRAALDAGADDVVLYSEPWKEAVRRISKGGADVVYDSVGSTLLESFEAARTGGHVVFYGMAGGDPPHIDPRMLMDTSKTLTGGDLWNVLRSHEDRVQRAGELFSWIRDGRLQVRIAARFPLSEGAKAHAFLEGRGSIGKVVLLP